MSLEDVYRAFAGTPRDTPCPPRVPPQPPAVEPSGRMGQVGQHDKQAEQREVGQEREIEMLLAALADAGRDLGPKLAHRLRETLVPLSQQVRAELLTVVDDAFEVALDVDDARRHAGHLLGDSAAVEAAKAVWPAYPAPPPIEALAAASSDVEPPWMTYVARHCELVPDDWCYLLHRLTGRPAVEADKLARQYVEAWAAAAYAEPQAHRRANAGRRAANAMLRGATM